MKSTILLIILILLLTLRSFSVVENVRAEDVCSNPDKQTECDNLIADLTSKISQAQDSAKSLASQIAVYDNQIALSTLKIQQNEQQITSISGKITLLETQLQNKVTLLQRQISHTYKQGGGDPIRMLLSSSNFSEMLQQFKYAQIIQSDNRRFLHDAQLVQSNFALQKQLVETSKKNLQIQKNSLAAARTAKDNLLKQTKNDEVNYQKLLTQAIEQKNAIQSFIAGQGGATLLANQTVCNDWGCYYSQRDAQWGMVTLGDSSSTIAQYGCLVTSVAMVASHYGKNIKPVDIARTSSAFFRDYLLYDINVNGISISRTGYAWPSISYIDTQLASGTPVIVGLYKGPAHFIVLKSGSNGNYVMNDPYIANGHDIPFTSHYSVGIISYAGILRI